MAQQDDGFHKPHVPPEQTSINVGRQVPAAPVPDDDDSGSGLDQIDPNEEPAVAPDRPDNGPVFDLADGPPALFDRQDADPDEERDDGSDEEIRRGSTK